MASQVIATRSARAHTHTHTHYAVILHFPVKTYESLLKTHGRIPLVLCQAKLFTQTQTKVLRVFRMVVTGLKYAFKPGTVKPNGCGARRGLIINTVM